jgi:hypothetical protein
MRIVPRRSPRINIPRFFKVDFNRSFIKSPQENVCINANNFKCNYWFFDVSQLQQLLEPDTA